MNNFLMKPKIDFAFKEIMNDEKARIGFLAAVLHIAPETIKSTRILNPYLRQTHADDKLGILDVRVLMNDDTEIDTEIQLSELMVGLIVLYSMLPKCILTKSSQDKSIMCLKNA